MNVLYIAAVNLNDSRGSSTHVREFIQNFSKYSDSMTVITLSEINLSYNNVLFKKAKFINVPFLSLISFSIYSFFLGSYILLTSKQDIIYERHNPFNVGGILSSIFKIPSITEVNGMYLDEMKFKGPLRQILKKLETITYLLVDKIIVVADSVKIAISNEYNLPENKLFVVENGVNADLFKPMDLQSCRKKLNLDLNNNHICYVGSLNSWQGLQYLIHAAPLVLKEFSNTTFLVVGSGEMKDTLIQLVNELKLSNNFIFTGNVPYGKIPLYINSADMCVAPFISSRKASPLKIYEYFACKKPVVASNISGVSELFLNSSGGLLVNPEDHKDLAKNIVKLLNDKNYRMKMGDSGYRYVLNNHRWCSVTERVFDICKKQLDSQHGK